MSKKTASDPIVGYQNWRHLVFLHWRVEPEQLQRHLPEGLTVETFDGSAWLALVPFAMERVRPWWAPAVPGISWFLETNVRTYVRHESGIRAVWFFSLDANSRLAVRIARTFWKLNYIDCQMTTKTDSTTGDLHYDGSRRRHSGFRYDVRCRLDRVPLQHASDGSLEHFLLERYSLLSQAADGTFLTAHVIHEPYRYRIPSEFDCEETYTSELVERPGVSPRPDHVAYSPGVDVRVTALEPLK
jgi:uncharacterized protein